MADLQGDWAFYGRKKELAELRRWLNTQRFHTISVIGGRGVGKTELIKEGVKSLNGQRPCIHLELPEIDRSDNGNGLSKHRIDVNNGLAAQARAEGLADVLSAPTGTDGLCNHLGYFRELLDCMLRHGAVVVLDEFQNARDLELVSYVKMVIDNLKYERDNSGGKIVVAGSHQQKILEMLFDARQPMYNRIDKSVRLFPLIAADVLEMAAAEGWLSKPHRFLTVYTAFGGGPYRWRRLFDEQESGEAPEPSDGQDKTWRREFVIREVMRYRNGPRERFLSAAYTNLSAEAREVAIDLAQNPRGVRWSRVVQKYGGAEDKARDGFRILQYHLGIAEFVPNSEVSAGGVKKVRLMDQAALFELNFDRGWAESGPDEAEHNKDHMITKVNQMEGIALESLAAEWLGSFKLFEAVLRSAEMRRPDNSQLEIDVIGETAQPHEGRHHIALCSCKRDSGRHDLQKSYDDFNLYLKMRADRGREFTHDCVRRFLVSPEWSHDSLKNDSFERFDLAEMARSLEFEVKPWPVGVSPEAGAGNIRLGPGSLSQIPQPHGRSQSDEPEIDI